jgi:hypothetical protein
MYDLEQYLLCVGLGLEFHCTRMLWLVDAYFAAAGKGEGSKFSPTLFAHLRDFDILRFEIFQGRRDVITHKVKFVHVVLLRIMERGFEWWHGEDQPAVACVNARKLKHITKEGPVSFRILRVDNDMCAIDQAGVPISGG